jgi:hypothetical protein
VTEHRQLGVDAFSHVWTLMAEGHEGQHLFQALETLSR